jgi:hypothetical protein
MSSLLAAASVPAPETEASEPASAQPFKWTAGRIVLSIFLFLVASVAEIGGGWLWWQTLRESKPWYLAVLGSGVLILYGVIPTFQPTDVSFSMPDESKI